MALKIVAEDAGVQYLIAVDSVGGANVVIQNVTCDNSVYVGSAVRLDSLGVAYNALADSLANSNVIGIVESKSSATVCNVRVLGVSEAIYSGLDVTKIYYLSDVTPGLITTSVPTVTGHVKLLLGQPRSATEFLIAKGERTVRG